MKGEEAFGDEKVHLDQPAHVSSGELVVFITVDVPTVDCKAELLAPSHQVAEEAGILRWLFLVACE